MYAVIMAGGSGTRFWPASRRVRPKQLLELWGEPMIRRTVKCLEPVVPMANQWVITGAPIAAPIAAALPGFAKEQIIAEPVGRNTAPCVGLAAMLLEEEAGETTFGLFPADHFIREQEAWNQCLKSAYREAESGAIITLGIAPTRPETGYGYIHFDQKDEGVSKAVHRFVEKPDRETALAYLEAGDYLWNGGIFVAKTSTMLAEIRRQMPALAEGLEVLRKAWRTPAWEKVFNEVYPTLPSTSIDYGVMEGAKEVRVVPAAFGWSDVGHWGAMDETVPADEAGNVSVGDALFLDAKGTLMVRQGQGKKLMVALNTEDLVIVDSDDALLVCPRSSAQEVRKVIDALKVQGREELL